jgi:uncharacterized protein YbdZ (MbtH family)
MRELKERHLFRVVVSCEGKYSVWPESLPIPDGWTDTGEIDVIQTCLRCTDEELWAGMQSVFVRTLH